MYSTTNIITLLFTLFTVLCALNSAQAQPPFYVLYGYASGTCTGTPLSITAVNTSCNPAGSSHPFKRDTMATFEYSECTETGLKIYSCEDSDCTKCSAPEDFPINTCSSDSPDASSQTRCEIAVPSFPDQSYRTLTTFTDDNCAGTVRSEYHEAVTLDGCSLYNGGWMSYYTKDICSVDGVYTRLRCSDSSCSDCSPLNIMSGCQGATNISCLHAVTTPATAAPTNEPATPSPATSAPTKAATKAPTKAATKAPTKAATKAPTKAATKEPTKAATKAPTKAATKAPTKGPRGMPADDVLPVRSFVESVYVPARAAQQIDEADGMMMGH